MSNDSSSSSSRGGVAVAGGLGAALLSIFGLVGRQADDVGRVAVGSVGRAVSRHVDDVGRIPMHHPNAFTPRVAGHGDDLFHQPRTPQLPPTTLDPSGVDVAGAHDWDGYKLVGKVGGKAAAKGAGKLLKGDKEEEKRQQLPFNPPREQIPE